MKIFDHLKSRPGLNTAIGIVFAIIAGLLLTGYISSIVRGKEGGPPRNVAVAARDIQAGQPVSPGDVRLKNIPSDYVVPGSLEKPGDIDGERALRFIGGGEPFTASSITGKSGEESLASRIPAQLRAYSVQLKSGCGAGQEIRPGDRVDVLATSGDPPGTDTILRDRVVLGTGSQLAQDDGDIASGAPRITLLVHPQEAELLAQAECVGEISISLCPLEGQAE